MLLWNLWIHHFNLTEVRHLHHWTILCAHSTQYLLNHLMTWLFGMCVVLVWVYHTISTQSLNNVAVWYVCGINVSLSQNYYRPYIVIMLLQWQFSNLNNEKSPLKIMSVALYIQCPFWNLISIWVYPHICKAYGKLCCLYAYILAYLKIEP